MVIEKVKQLDEQHARKLLTWLQGQERATAPARQPGAQWPCSVSPVAFDLPLAPPPIGWKNFAPESVSKWPGWWTPAC